MLMCHMHLLRMFSKSRTTFLFLVTRTHTTTNTTNTQESGEVGSPCNSCPVCGACAWSKLTCGFLGLCWCTVVWRYNSHAKGRRRADDFVRVRWRCLAAAGSQSSPVGEKWWLVCGESVSVFFLPPAHYHAHDLAYVCSLVNLFVMLSLMFL